MSSNKAISNLERNISNRTTTKNVSINNAHLVNANEKKDSISVVTKSLMASKSKKEHMIGTSPRPNSSGKIHKTSIHQEDMTDSLSDQLTPKQSSGKKTNAEQKSICCTSSSQRTYTPTRNSKSISKISNEEIKSKRCILSTKTKIPGQDKSGKQETFQNKYDTNVKSKPVHSPRFIKKNLVIDNSPNLRSTPESTEIRSNTICDKIKLNNSTQENTLKQISPVKNKQKFPNLSENLPSLSKRGHFENKFKSTQLNSAVSVYVRVRPFTNRESLLTDIYNIISVEDNSITVRTEAGNAYHFSFDSCISPNTSNTEYDDQEFTYNKIAVPLLDHALEGYNICLFAYGQTGSGKSYSMMGTAENPGIIPRFCKQLFSCTSRAENKIKYVVEMSYFEIYNEKIYDLLMPSNTENNKVQLKVREHPTTGPYIQDLTSYVVTSYNDLLDWINLGNKYRATAITGMNDRSSRSHSIFTINLIQIKNETTDGECHTHETTSHINLVDLAGSERIAKSETSEERLKEGVNINKSLLTLGKVIAHLVERGSSQNNEVGSNLAARKHIFVPYRESTLTWLLKDSLGGNSRTAMLATVSPCNTHIEETLSTLRFARQTSKIVNVVRINDDPKARLIKELKAEIEKLRSQHQGDDIKYFMDEIAILKSQLQETQALLDSSKKNWEERLQQTEKRKEEEKLKLKKVGIALKMEGVYPSLINLNDDPQLSETLLYVLKPGITKVGRLEEQSTAEIQLHGRLIASNHCVIKNEDRLLTITPNKDALVYINGQLIIEITKLQHGDRLVIGGEHFFRVNNPFEEEVLPVNSENRDFEYAYQELISVQESKLQEEIGKCRQKRCSEILEKFENLREEIELSMQKSFESVLESENDEHDLGTELQSKKSDIKEFVPYSSDFLDKITEMFNDVSSDLDNWKSKLDMTLQTGIEYESQQKQEKVGSLYQLSVRLKEANELTKELGTDIVLNRCDVLTNTGLELAIKVHSVNHNIATFWSLETFEERLERLRKLVQEFSSDKNAFCEVFEATDIWESQDEIPINILSDSKCDLKNIQKRLTQSLSSTGSSDMVFSFSDFHRSLNESLEPSSSVSSIFLITESCRSQLTKAIDMDHPLSLLNQAVLTCSNIWQQINKIKDQELFKNKGDTINLIIILTSDIRCLRSIISGWICIYINEDVPNWMRTRCINSQVANLKKILLDLEKVIVFIFQGMGKNLENLINQSIDMAQHTICSLITNFGEMSIVSSDTLHASVFKKINEKLSNNMLECAVDFIKKLCQISFEEIEDYELQYNSIIEDSFFSTLKEPWLIFSAAKHATIKLKEYLNLFCFNKEYEIKDDLSRFYSFAKDIARHIAQMTDGIVDFLSAIDLMFKGNSHGDALNLTKKNLVQLIYSFDKHCQWPLKLTEKQLEEKQKEIIQALQLVSTAIDGQLKDISLLMNGTIFQPGENNIQDNSDMPSQISGSSSVFALSSFFTSQLEDVIDI